MGWSSVMFPDGPYQINHDGIARLVRTAAHAWALDEETEITTESQGTEYLQPLPRITLVKTDWTAVKKRREIFVNQLNDDFNRRLSSGMTGKQAMDCLERMVALRDDATNAVLDKQRQATRTSMAEIASCVTEGENRLAASKFVVKASAEAELALVAGVAFAGLPALGIVSGAPAFGVSAGAAATAAFGIGAGSVLKGVAKYADTQKIGGAVAETAIEVMVNSTMLALKPALVGSKVAKFGIALIFGFMKKTTKEAIANAFASPEEIASRKKKSLLEMWTSIIASTPSAIVSDALKAVSTNAGFLIPATIALKMTIEHLSGRAAKAARDHQDPKTSAQLGRSVLHHTRSSFLMDAAQPEDDFVTRWALRPLACNQ